MLDEQISMVKKLCLQEENKTLILLVNAAFHLLSASQNKPTENITNYNNLKTTWNTYAEPFINT